MSSSSQHILALPGLRDGGNITVDQVIAELRISEKQAKLLLNKLVLHGRLRRWPGIAGQPATYHVPAPAKTAITEKYRA